METTSLNSVEYSIIQFFRPVTNDSWRWVTFTFALTRFFVRNYLQTESKFTLDRAKEKCRKEEGKKEKGWWIKGRVRGWKLPGRNYETISPEGMSCAVCPLNTNTFPIAVHRSYQGYRRERKTGLPILKGRLWVMYNVCACLVLFIRRCISTCITAKYRQQKCISRMRVYEPDCLRWKAL